MLMRAALRGLIIVNAQSARGLLSSHDLALFIKI
jgi:hypothetical protein